MEATVTGSTTAIAPATPAPAATPAPTEPIAPVEPPAPERTFSQKELDEIVERRLSKERKKRDELTTRLRVTEELALRRTDAERKDAPAPKQVAEGEPTRDQYSTYEEFIEARAEYRADIKVDKKFQERDAKDRERNTQTEQQKAGEEFRKRAKENAKDVADFDEVISGIGPDDPVSKIAAMPIEASEAPGKILYHLAKNPDEAERIASLPLGQQAREIWKLEQTLASAKPPVKPSAAPEPIKPLGGSKAVSGDEMPDPNKNGGKDWLDWRNRMDRVKRQGNRAA